MVASDGSQPGPEGTSSGRDAGSDVLDGIRGMVSFFTVFRLNVGEREISSMERNFRFVPVVGFIVGLVASMVGFAFHILGFGGAVTAAAVLASVFIISKFLHFDGLTDFGDGVIATGPVETRIRALKDTNIGAGGFGVAFIVTLLSFAALAGFGGAAAVAVLIWPLEIMVKNSMVAAAAYGLPSNGMAANQVRSTGKGSVAVSSVLSFLLSAVAVLVMGGLVSLSGGDGPGIGDMLPIAFLLLASVAVSVFAGWMMAKVSNDHFGFVNGDVLGAANEVSRPLILIVVFALIGVGFV